MFNIGWGICYFFLSVFFFYLSIIGNRWGLVFLFWDGKLGFIFVLVFILIFSLFFCKMGILGSKVFLESVFGVRVVV